ncbi:MAG: regulatory iron-sulfur-containing complex subunit RicT [Planctomycetota bacterium]
MTDSDAPTGEDPVAPSEAVGPVAPQTEPAKDLTAPAAPGSTDGGDAPSQAAEPAATPQTDQADAAGAAKPQGNANGSRGRSNGERRRRGKSGSRRQPSGEALAARVPWDEPLALVRYGRMARVELFRCALDPVPRRDTQVVIRTERGVELGVVVGVLHNGNGPAGTTAAEADTDDDPPPACTNHDGCVLSCGRIEQLMRSGGTELGYNRQNKVLRPASPQDLNDQEHLDRNEREKRIYCDQQARELGLKMRLVTVEHLLGGERVVFYFTSESRVDFRELVRRLAGQYRTRIEMRQIGARDEARLVGDYERCGQRCCCQAFLGSLQPVSIRMAKVQKATLDPSKISGRCNRLMCCLRYEDQTYEYLRKQLPRKNTWVRTDDVVGKVVATQVLTQLVRLIDTDGAMVVVDNEAVLERDISPPPPKEATDRRPSRSDRGSTPEATPSTRTAAGDATPSDGAPKRRRGRRRRKKSGGGGQAQGQASAPAANDGNSGGGQPKKKRRRRRRRKKSGGQSSPPSEGQ